MVALQIGTHAAAKILRGERLPYRADVVALAFDREERHAADGGGLDAPAAHPQLAGRERAVLEHRLHRLEVELRRQVHRGEVFLVEAARRLRLRAVAAQARLVDFREGVEMPLE